MDTHQELIEIIEKYSLLKDSGICADAIHDWHDKQLKTLKNKILKMYKELDPDITKCNKDAIYGYDKALNEILEVLNDTHKELNKCKIGGR